MIKKWWEEDAAASQQDVMAAIGAEQAPVGKEQPPEGNWWEEDHAFRSDGGPKAVLSAIEADKKRQEDQSRLHEAHQSIETYGEIPTVASQVVTDTTSLVHRLFGNSAHADNLNRDSDILSQAMSERDAARWQSEQDPEGMSTVEQAGQYVPFLKQGVRGAARSLGSAVLGAKGAGAIGGAGKIAAGGLRGAAAGAVRGGVAGAAAGAAQGAGAAARGALGAAGGSAGGAIGLASSQEANRAITEGADAGLEGTALAGYVASQGIIEALPATVMQRLGLGGVEAMIAGPSIRGGIKAGLLETIKRTGQEIPEELVTEIGHAVATEYSGLDPSALSGDSLASLVADTVLQTALMGAGAGAMKTIEGAVQGQAASQKLAALDKPPGAHKWAEIVLGKRERYAEAPDEATRAKQWEQSRGSAVTKQQPPLTQGPKDASQVQPNEGSVPVQGDAAQGSQVPGSAQVQQTPQAETEAGTEVPVAQSKQESDEPPVAEGMTRLYHGSATPGRVEGKAWFSTDRRYAENYRGKDHSELQYVDMPTEWANKQRDPDNYGQTVDKGFTLNVELDSSETGPRKTLGGKVAPEAEVAKQPVKPAAEQADTAPTKQPAKPAGDVVRDSRDGKLYREDPNAKTPAERIRTRQPVDPSEGVVLVTKDQWGKPISPEITKARQEFVDKAKPGAEFELEDFKGSRFQVQDDGGLLEVNSRRAMSSVQEMANTIAPGKVTWKEASTTGPSEGTTGSPTVSPDAPGATLETSKGKAAGENQSSEARADSGARRMEPTEEGRPADGKPVMPGDRFLTNTGRETTPYPKYDSSTNRKSINSEKKAQQWLLENAIAEAESRGDDFNLTTFRSELEDARKGKLPQASKDSATLYVFGDYIPKVPKPFLKDFPKQPSEARADESPETRLDAMPRLSRPGIKEKPSFVKSLIPTSEVESDMERALTADEADESANEYIERMATVESVPIEQIESGQTIVKAEDVRHFIKNPKQDDLKSPLIIQFGDKMILRDGNTRVNAAILRGENSIQARVLYVSDKSIGKQPKETTSGREIRVPVSEGHAAPLGEGAGVPPQQRTGTEAGKREATQPESKWQSETRASLEAVPALKGAKIEADEKAGTVKVTRSDGLTTTIHFNADEELAKAALKKGRNPKSIHGRYVREPGATQGDIYIRSDADHTNILNHEVMHWLEDSGIVTADEVEQYGGREAIAEKYGKWAELKQRKKDSVFQRIYDALEPVFSSQRRFFEEVGKRQTEQPAEKPFVFHGTQRLPSLPPSLTSEGKATGETTKASADQVNVDSGEKGKVKPDAQQAEKATDADFYASMKELMAGLTEPESGLTKPTGGRKKPAARKPRSVKKQPAKTPEEKSADDRARAAAKLEEARRKMREAFKDTQNRPLSGFDPQIGMKVAQATKLYIEAGILDFRAFVRDLVADFGRPWVEDKTQYLESAWQIANELKWVNSPAGKVADVLTEVRDERTQGEPGAEGNESVGDGSGESQGDAAATSTATDERRDATEDARQPGDSILPDGTEASQDDGRERGAGSSADGDTDTDQSDKGPAGDADTGAGSPDGSMDERLAVNHVIGQDDDLAVSSLTESLARNIKALNILKVLEKDGRFPDAAERKALAQYTGWGGLSQALDSIKGERMLSEDWRRDEAWEKKWGKAYRKLKGLLTKEEFQAAQDSTENAHYTSKPIIQSIWKIAERLGYNGGRVLELGAGIGHFAGLVPSRVRGATQFTMVERDSVSSRIVKMLYPGHEVVAGDMEEFKAVPGSVTLGIGNVPFAGGTVGDSVRRYNEPLNLHNYAIARHLDAVAPGGIVVAVSSHSTLDANIKQRKFLTTKGELIGAIRLPNNAFAENAKTEVVTDILIFRRPRQGDGTLGVRLDQNADVTVKNKDGEEVTRAINKYFLDNPEMVLGKHSAKGSMYGPDEYTVESTPGDLQSKIDAAIERLPRDLLGSIDVAEKVVASDESVPFGRLEIHSGKVVMGFGDKFVPIAGKKFADFPVHLTGKTGVSRAKDYIALRDVLADVRKTMLDEGATDADVKRAQRKLSTSYDRYVKAYGPLNSAKTSIFKRDPDYYRVLALENERAEYNPETKKIEITYTKAAIFTDRVLGPQKEPDKADSPADAMSVSIAWRGAIDSVFIGKLLGVSPQEADGKLLEEGLAFRNPSTTELELAELYLSGNVRAKLEQAKITAEEDPQYARNVEALTKVQPKPITLKKDTVRLGATWIPEQVINAFATQEFGTDVTVTYNANTDAWTVGRVYGISETAKSKYETGRIDPDDLLAEVLNLRSIKIYDQVETGEYTASGKPKTTQTLNEKETQAAKHRAAVLRAEFEKWVLGNPEVTKVLAKLYNDKYNNFVRTKYNGEFLVLPGANPEVILRPYQKDAIWRIINRGTSLLAHAVGAGKTYTMIGAAMEMRRLGLARRPLLVVQNATLGQFAKSFQQMYPNANVLVADKNDLGKGKRQLFLNKISTGNWDAVVIAQSTFDNMASEPEVERAFIQDQLDLLEEAIREEGGETARTPTVKQLVRTKKSLKARFDKLMGSRSKKEDNVTFEDLGADALFLDEAHAYKKPTFTTKLSQLVGLNVEASARSLATTIKVRSIQAAHNGRNVILATGTPVTNTLGEAWHMVNYVSPATNVDFSSRTFDQFVGNFAQVEPTLTMNAGGQYVYKDAIVKFRNGHQLVEYINDSWDIVTPDALRAYMASSKKGFPALRGGQPSAITVDRTPGVAVFMDFISQVYTRYKGLTAKERRELSFIPALAYGASKAATLDIRLVVPNAAEEKNSKLQKAAEEIKRIYDESAEVKGAQLFFSDMKNPFSMSRLRQFMGGEAIDTFAEDSNTDIAEGGSEPVEENESGSFLYQELKKKLLGMGIPREQIAFISDAKTDKQRQALFERVNNGDIRVLIGSTAKMGIGVNVQKKLVALHHFDTPWLPADLEQREGRILRFGNENETVDILRYAMKKTLDGAIYMATARKQKFIWQVLNGQLDGDSFEDPSSAAMLSIEEQLAAIQDDPVFFEKIEIQNRLREMELERQSFYDAQQRMADSLSRERYWLDKEETGTLPQWQRRLEKVKKLQAIKDDGGLEKFVLTYGKQTFYDPKKAAEFIKSKVDEISKYVIENHDKSRSFDQAGGLLSLGKSQKVEFEIGPAKVVIGAEPKGAFVQNAKGETVTEFSARVKSIAYLQEPGGRHEFYEGTATTPATFFEKMKSLPEEAQTEVNRSEAAVSKYQAKIAEIEGLMGKQWEDQTEYDTKKERLAEIEGQMLASKGNLSAPEPEADQEQADDSGEGDGTAHSITPNVVERTSVAAGTPQQSSRADFSFTEGETPQGKKLLNRMKGDSVKRKIGPRSILNFLKDVVRVASIEGKSQLSRKNPGHYKPREHLVRSRTGASGVIDTHEAGHALSAILRDVDPRILKRHQAGLVALTQIPNSMASGVTAEEGMAEFVRRYITDYKSLPESLRMALEADIAMVSPGLLSGLKDANRLWQQFLARPLQERLDASKNDRQPRKIGRGFRDAVYRSLYNIIGGDVAIHKIRRELERPLFKYSQDMGREFREKASDTKADIDNAYQSVIRVPVETQRAIFGDTRSKEQGVSIVAFGDNMFSDEDAQFLRDGGFKVPTEFTHGERVYLTNQNFEQIREKLGDDWDAFENYGQLRASLERAEKKGHQSAWMHENVSQAEAKQAIADMESGNPTWTQRFDEVREFFDGLLLVATLSGEYSPTEAVKIRNAWDSYWPLLRQVTAEENSRVGRGGPDPAAGVHRAFGSALPLRNLLEAVEMRTKAAMQAYYTNRMMLAMRQYSDTLHAMDDAPFDIRKAGARLMVPLKMDLKKVATLSPAEQAQWIVDYMNKQMQDEARQAGEEVDPDELYTVEDVAIDMPWRPIFRGTRPGAIQVIGLTENGQRKYYQVTDPLLFDLFSNAESMSRYATWMARFFAKGIAPWKRALTQNLAFAVRNLPRDSVTALTMGESGKSFVPGAFLAYGIVGRLNGSLGKDAPARAELFSRSMEALHSPRHRKLWDSFKEAATEGILVPGYSDMNFYDRVSEAPGQLSAVALWPVAMFNWATAGRYISQLSEELQREGAFLEARGQGRSYEYAQRQYDQISGNFSQRQPNHATATFVRSAGFLNPGLQIMWGQMKRWHDPDPRAQKLYLAKLPALAAWFSVSSAINIALVYAMFGDDEEKLEEVLNDMRERPNYEQDTTMSVMGTVRLPFEYGLSGAVSSFAWNATEDALLGGSNESIQTRLKAFLARATQIPGPTDAIHPYLKTAIELKMGDAGYSMYRNDSIVPEQLIVQYPVNPEMRAYDDTPSLFKMIGEGLTVSPLKVEYAVGSLLTGTASDLIALGGKLTGGKTLEAKDFPIISRLMQRPSTGFRSQAVRELRKVNQEVEAMGVKINAMGDAAPKDLLDQYAKLQEASLAYDVVSGLYDDVKEEVDAAETDRSAVEATERQMTRFARQFLNYQAGKAPQPKQLKDRKHEYYGLQTYHATGSPESKSGLATQEKAVAALKLSGFTLQQAKQAMADHWESPDENGKKGTIWEWKGNRKVLKDAVAIRYRKLEALFKAK